MHRHELSHLKRRQHSNDAIRMGGGGFLDRLTRAPKGSRMANIGAQLSGRKSGNLRKGLDTIWSVTRKQILPVALPMVGTMIAGPIGGTIGGAVAGGLRSHDNVGRNMLQGAGQGLAISTGIGLLKAVPTFISGFGGAGSAAGAGTGMGGAHSLGGNLASSMGGSSFAGGASGAAGAGAFSKLLSPFGGIGNALGSGMDALGVKPLDALLMAGTAYGNMAGKTKPNKQEEEQYNKLVERPHPYDTLPKPKEGFYLRHQNPDYLKNLDFENPYEAYTFEEPFLEHMPPQVHYAEGGYVHGGAIPGNSGGQADDYDTHIPEGSYVWDATSTSLLGDGNSEKGIKEIKHVRDRFLESGITNHRNWNPRSKVKVKLSPGEIVIEPEVVTGLGKGNPKKGVKMLDNARKKLRKEKGLKNFLPPKSKSMEHYLRG